MSMITENTIVVKTEDVEKLQKAFELEKKFILNINPVEVFKNEDVSIWVFDGNGQPLEVEENVDFLILETNYLDGEEPYTQRYNDTLGHYEDVAIPATELIKELLGDDVFSTIKDKIRYSVESKTIKNDKADSVSLDQMREIVEKEVPYASLKKDGGIFEFHECDGLSIGVSYESTGPDGEKLDNYIYNLFYGEEYINISGYGTNENPLPEDVLHEMVEEWNSLISKEISTEISDEDIKSLQTLVSLGLDYGLIDLSVRENSKTAQIGDYWFYFDGSYVDETFQFESIPKEELVGTITNALVEIKEELNDAEFSYYKAVLIEGVISNLKKDLEEQMKANRDGFDEPQGFVPLGEESLEIIYDETLKQYSALLHDKDGVPVLPYMNGDTIEGVLLCFLDKDGISTEEKCGDKKMEEEIGNWYRNKYPEDDLGSCIPSDLSFNTIYNGLLKGEDVYAMLGEAADSLVRERIFTELTNRMGVGYDYIYDLWLNAPKGNIDLGNGKKPKIDILIHDAKDTSKKGIKDEMDKNTAIMGDSLNFR